MKDKAHIRVELLKEQYLKLANTPANAFSESDLLKLLDSDTRVKTFRRTNRMSDNGYPIYYIESETLHGEYKASQICNELYDSREERSARLEERKWMESIHAEKAEISKLFFELDEIKLETAIVMLNALKAKVPKVQGNILWHETFGFDSLEKKLRYVDSFEKAMKTASVSHNDILRTIHVLSTGRRMKDREKPIIEKVTNFFHDFFKTPDTVFDWSWYRDIYQRC